MVTMVETMTYYSFLATIMGSAASALVLWLKRDWLKKAGILLTVAALIMMGVAIARRTMIVGRIPLNSVFEYLLMFSFALLIVALVAGLKFKSYGPAAIVLGVTAVLIGISFGKTDVGGPLLPALQSNWRVSHVMTAIISYSAFALAFGVGVYYLIVIPRKVAVKEADEVIRLASPDLKSVSFFASQLPLYADPVFGLDRQIQGINVPDADLYMPIDEAKSRLHDPRFVIPYSRAVKQQMLDGKLTEPVNDKRFNDKFKAIVEKIVG